MTLITWEINSNLLHGKTNTGNIAKELLLPLPTSLYDEEASFGDDTMPISKLYL